MRNQPRRKATTTAGTNDLVGAGSLIRLRETNLGPPYRVLRSLFVSNVVKNASDTCYSWDFSLSDVASNSEFVAIFQQWKLERVVADFTWEPSSTAGSTPMLYVACDPTVTTTSGLGLDDLLARRYATHAFNTTRNTCSFEFRPRASELVASSTGVGATVNAAVMPSSTWLSTANATTSYGTLLAWVAFYNSGLASAGNLQITFRYYFAFRGSKR
jgi:hypothetical protein